MRNRHRRVLRTSDEATRACYWTVRVVVLCAVGFASALFAGCGELEPMREPEMVDLELAKGTLQASVRDAQRMVTELRTDLEVRRKELAEAQVARAQLEGRVREAERRVIEARQVIELQREELAAARTERQRVSRSSLQLQGQINRLQKQLSITGKLGPAHNGQGTAPIPSSGAMRKGQKAMQVSAQRNQPSEFLETPQMVAPNREPSLAVERQMALHKHVFVKFGDTLWSFSQKYHVSVERLRMLNQLTDNTIVIGQALWLPQDRPMSGVGADKGSSTP